MPGNCFPVDHRRIRRRAGLAPRHFLERGRVGGQQAFDRHGLQFANVAPLEAELSQQRVAVANRVFWRRQPEHRAAFDDGAMIETLGAGHRHQRGDFTATPGLAEDGHLIGIAAEAPDVFANPFERLHNIQHPCAARKREIRAGRFAQISEAENVEAVIDRNHHHVAGAREVRAFDDGPGAGAA